MSLLKCNEIHKNNDGYLYWIKEVNIYMQYL